MDYDNHIDKRKTEFESSALNTRIVSLKNMNNEIVKEIVEECNKRDFDYIVSQIDMDNFELINELIDNGFKVFGYPIILKTDLNKEYEKNNNVRVYKKTDLKELKQITRGAFRNAHWYHDRHLKKEDVDALYLEWLRNSCDGRAEIVLVYEKNNEVLGYIACNKKKDTGIIDLIAVSDKAKGRGIGKALVNAALEYFKKINLKEMEVKTEMTNITVLNLYNN